MDPTDHLLALAHGVVTFADVLTSLDEAEDIGVPVGYTILGTVRGKLRMLASQWWTTTHDEPVWHDTNTAQAVVEAREWVNTHRVRLAELREQESSSDN